MVEASSGHYFFIVEKQSRGDMATRSGIILERNSI
jgi:hypothetical protein